MYRINRKKTGQSGLKQNCGSYGGHASEYLSFPSLDALTYVLNGVSTRVGGVSEGCFSGMNMSFTRGDRPEAVMDNYREMAALLGCRVEDMVTSQQTHTTNIRYVTEADKGKGILRNRDYTDVDGLITDTAGIVLVTYYADCVPLLFVDPKHRAVGLAHSGWRGTAAGMGACMVQSMEQHFASRAEDLYAAIGPSICGDCYEVNGEVAQQFEHYSSYIKKKDEPDKYLLDLWGINRIILEESGIRPDHIECTDICTKCNSEYLYSHRVSGDRRGNFGVFLGIRKD